MEYLTDTSDERAAVTESAKIRGLHREVQRIRTSEEMGVKYMQKWEERVYDRMDGKEEGLAEGRYNINQLNQALIRDNRLEDLVRSATDSELQEELLKEYHIGV